MKLTSESGRFIGFRSKDAHEFLSEMKDAKGMKLMWLVSKDDDTYDPITFAPKKSEFYLAQFEVPKESNDIRQT